MANTRLRLSDVRGFGEERQELGIMERGGLSRGYAALEVKVPVIGLETRGLRRCRRAAQIARYRDCKLVANRQVIL